jgi:hypothetical protein
MNPPTVRRFCVICNDLRAHRGHSCTVCYPAPGEVHPALAEPLDMFDAPREPEPDPFEDPLAGFRAFHEANPQVLAALVTIARELVRDGETKFGVKALFERLRWDRRFRTESGEPWKLNNSYTAPYARLMIEAHPKVEPYLETRRSKFDGLAA